MSKSNKKLGTEFEAWLCDYGYNLGFFAHKLQQSKSGQPFDIVFARNETSLFVDAKVCHGIEFELSRMEENQCNAFSLLNELGCKHTYFAFRFTSGLNYVYKYCDYKTLDGLKKHGYKKIGMWNLPDLEEMFGNVIINGMIKRWR